jgi:2-keto-4-pentenoate hydratase
MDSEAMELSQALAVARAHSELVESPTRDLALAEAYAVQAHAFAARGEAVAGWKLALTNPVGQARMGVEHPALGRLAAADISWGAFQASEPPRFEVGPGATYAEAELLVVLVRDLPARLSPYDSAEVAAAIGAVHAGIELCGSRYRDDEVGVGALVADNSFADRLVIGTRLATQWEGRLAHMDVRLEHGDGLSVTGNTDAVMGSPLGAVVWLANWLSARGESLRRGQVVATGSCTGMTRVEPGEVLCARFAGAGEATARMVRREKRGGSHDH